MSDRIDHATEAARLLELAAQDVSLEVQREAVDAMNLANGSYRAVDAEAVNHD